jgi:two-component system, OmpR family, sensor histidine kinase TctE
LLNFKQTLHSNSISRQLFKWLLALILPIVLISIASSYWFANLYINKTYDKNLYRTALALANQVELNESGLNVDLPEIAKELLEFDEDDDIYFRIIGPKGDLIESHRDLPLPKVYPRADRYLFYEAIIKDEKLRTVVYALPRTDVSIAAKEFPIYVMVGETINKRALITEEAILSMVLPQLIIIIILYVFLFYGIKHGLQPLDKLKTDLSKRDINDLCPVSHSNIPDELQPFIAVLNNLFSRLSNAVEKQQRFISDAAHQLKTPLAGLKTQSEITLREKNAQKRAHALNKINQASENLSHLVNQLLSLSKAEPDSTSTIIFESINLVSLAKEVSADWVPKALEKNIDLGFYTEEKATIILGNKLLLREMMNNLIDNAIRYTPYDGKVTIGINSLNNSTNFYVQDNGMGISKDDKTRIFERFYRALGTQQEGSGLGLNIVKEIAERHQASVSFFSEGLNAGAIFTVTFVKNNHNEL